MEGVFALKSWAKLGHFLQGGMQKCASFNLCIWLGGEFPGRRPELGALNNH